MSDLTASPHFLSLLAALLSRKYGLEGVLQRLDGEFDLNFLLRAGQGQHFIVKVMHAECDIALVDMQCTAIRRVHDHDPDAKIPVIVPTIDGGNHASLIDELGNERIVWIMSCLAGEVYASLKPRPRALVGDIGKAIARFNTALASFHHPLLERDIKWDLRKPHWIAEHLDLLADQSRHRLVKRILAGFDQVERSLERLPRMTLHNDLNDYNILIERIDGEARLSGLIDFGDLLYGPLVCELAIAGAYLVLDEDRPLDVLQALVAGYHKEHRLSVDEIEIIWPLLLTRLSVSVVNAAMMKRERPDDLYVSVTEGPAWAFLERYAATPPKWVSAHLRIACNLPAADDAEDAHAWISANSPNFRPVMELAVPPGSRIDASVASLIPANPLAPDPAELGASAPEGTIGRYAEPRLVHARPAQSAGAETDEHGRTVYLGIDLFAPAGQPVHAPLSGTVHASGHDGRAGGRGGAVVLRHDPGDGTSFFTFYGHLSQAASLLTPGATIAAGDLIGHLGTAGENGGWATHLRFQLCLCDLGLGIDWPETADPDEAATWLQLFPNPAALVGIDPASVDGTPHRHDSLRARRRILLGGNLKLSYSTPLSIARGWRHFLFDSHGRRYLDAYNNVPHVGHGHPRVAAVAARQSAILSTNTRYLHDALPDYAEALVAKLPEPLRVCYFVNSASEGNELALRLARAATGARDTIVMEQGYHGNTNAAIDISAYKFDGPGGRGAPDWVHVVPQPDPYRGRFKRENPDAGRLYARCVADTIERITAQGRNLAAFICEPLPSVGGQIVLADHYLREVYRMVRAAGGCCIADEVQTGLGRLGRYFWGFETQDVVPDIIVLGKPLGNGHPIAAVVTTRHIAERFDNGMEFFSTFGGNTVSAAIGHEVLRIIEDEALADNAERTGQYLRQGLDRLRARFPVIGDVRGHGLFLGVELVLDQDTLEPASMAARHLVHRLLEERILAGTEGRFDNVLKIRPPLTFDFEAADILLSKMEKILLEDPMQPA